MNTETAVAAVEDQPRAVTPVDVNAGTYALAAMSDDEFTFRLEALKRGRARIEEIQGSLLTEGVDFGSVAGSKLTLLKPGAEKLADFYRYAADFEPQRLVGDGVTAPPFTYLVKCRLHLGSLDGPVVATGFGAANVWEERNNRPGRKRLVCPECGSIGSLKFTARQAYWCIPDRGGCGANVEKGDERIRQIEATANPWDLENTVCKIAEKRSFVDGVLRATAASGLFTQDIEDADHSERPDGRPPSAPPAARGRPTSSRSAAPQATSDEPPWPAGPESAATIAQRVVPDAITTDADGGIYAEQCPKHRRPWKDTPYGLKCTARDEGTGSGYCEIRPSRRWIAEHEAA